MNIYFTIEPCRRLKNIFSNLSSFYIIDIDSILEESGLDVEKKSHQFLINSEIDRLLVSGARSKRYAGMIYINSKMNLDTMKSVKDTVMNVEGSTIEDVIILDDCDVPKMKDYYKFFDEVIFFPTLNKRKIIRCVPKNVAKSIR